MTKPVTIDNLGIDPSQRYARDVAETDKDFFKDSSSISKQTSVFATSPYISDFEELFGTWIRNPSWANFSPPPNFASHAKNLFTYQIVPSLGSPEEIEKEIQTLENKPFKRKKKKRENKDQKEQSKEQSFEEPSEEEESQKILSMLQCIQRFDKILELINARKGEFQKG